ncbi:MAG: type II secretion system F family protein [Myxococcota bacterium]|nr:type II secretion system F family protein [Myxococcota bacterium]
MAVFMWEAESKVGEIKRGEMVADSRALVERNLFKQQLRPRKIRKKPREINLKIPGLVSIGPRDLMLFTRQFATMIDAGLPLVQALDILATQSDNPELRVVVHKVKHSVESGESLSDSLAKHPRVFDTLFVSLVEAGEIGGILDTTLNRLAVYIEMNTKLLKQVKGAMVYPILMMGVASIIGVVMLLFVIPVFEGMFGNMGQTLPGPTQFVIDLSHSVQDNIGAILLGGTAVVLGFIAFKRSKPGQMIIDRVVLRIPIIGDVVRKVAVAKFTRTMATMLSSGVPIIDALEVVARASGNAIVESGLNNVREAIMEGRPMSAPMEKITVFPSMVVQMIGVGEATGAMDTMLSKIADFYEDEVDAAVVALMSVLEPLIMVFLAVFMGGFMIAMYLPVFSMAGGV